MIEVMLTGVANDTSLVLKERALPLIWLHALDARLIEPSFTLFTLLWSQRTTAEAAEATSSMATAESINFFMVSFPSGVVEGGPLGCFLSGVADRGISPAAACITRVQRCERSCEPPAGR